MSSKIITLIKDLMKILITQDTDWLTRYPVQTHHLAEMLSLRGHEIRVIDYEILWQTQSRSGLYSKREVFNNVSRIHKEAQITVIRPGIVKVPWLDYVSLLFTHKKEIDRQMEEFKPDIVVGFSILNTYLGMRAAKKNGIPFVYYWVDVLHRLIPFILFQPIGKIIESITLKRADRVLVINDKLEDYVITMGAPCHRTQVLRTGVNRKQFNPNTSSELIRRQYGLEEDDIIIFFMGWLYNFSGLKEVALRLTELKNNKLKLLIVGVGDAYEELKHIQEKYNLQDKVILTGNRPYREIPAFIAASDICLLPAYPTERTMRDIVPMKMYEYMAMRKPVIATKLPGVMKEFGEDNGVIYVDKSEDVAEKALQLVANEELHELGFKARRFVERYGWDKITDEFEGILKEVIKEKRSEAIT